VERARKRIARSSPREASRSGRGQRRSRVLATPIASAGSPALLAEVRASSAVRPNGHARPGSRNHCAARCFGRGPAQPSRDGRVGASRLARKHVSFRRLQKLDSGRHGAAAAGEQSPVAAARRASRSIARSTISPGGGESRARSGRCQPARRTTGRRVFLDVSNRGGGSIEVVW
jgi:hypothetical protein